MYLTNRTTKVSITYVFRCYTNIMKHFFINKDFTFSYTHSLLPKKNLGQQCLYNVKYLRKYLT